MRYFNDNQNDIIIQRTLFMVDDVFIGTDPSTASALGKYEVYLDGVKKGDVSGTTFKFAGLTEGTHKAGVKAVYASGITEMSEVEFTVVLTDIKNVNDESVLTIYPNPVHDILNIAGNYQMLEIINLAGEVVMNAENEIQNAGDVSQLNVNSLPAGVYIIKAHYDGKVGTYKIVKK